ncbi:hypothetical protein AGABI1DRAFT_44965 [Agaricus bisporus var. burnettii JB137-S8]|uniref:Uncharacterized protein n=1 Tax=Agaricus bisporus var. burnettii (strain JB137-S8 / ATCC MYA-4627 / FGSC 10392) TaxID=597362 RepID=K5XNU4_AGABU|nr:uncharacterized protein AGABI1DRAFT_44965 [Agaricus bisporus var. burnettii JB137-S8]EKM76345.1 hypothetical protein AGABI1DRAFT_44965 [Agaricus bisporus var. burnettii JB137-S8]
MKKKTFQIDAAQVVALFMEMTFFACLRVLTTTEGRFKPLRHIHLKMLLAAIIMFVCASLDVAFHLRHNLDVFTASRSNAVEEFSKTSSWINVISMGCYVVQTFVGDSILLYRCWILWGRNWFVILAPAASWLTGTGKSFSYSCGILTVYTEATLRNNKALLNASNLLPFITSMLSLTLVTNLCTTSLMVYRIQVIRNRLKRESNSTTYAPLTDVMRLLIESGLLYTSSIAILFVLYTLSNNGQYGVSNAVVQIIGITFNLIITRVDRGEATQPASQNTQTGTTVRLHAINIQTTVSRFSDPMEAPRVIGDSGAQKDSGSSCKEYWHSC